MANGKNCCDRSIRHAGRELDDPGAGSREPCRGTHDEDRFVHERADAVVRRLHLVGMDLHAALSRIEESTAARSSAAKIDDAVRGVDAAIKDVHRMIFDLENGDRERQGPGSVQALIIDAVDQACGQVNGERPSISLGSDLNAVADAFTAPHVARLVHRVLVRLPADRLSDARIEVTADPRPQARLIIQIEARGLDMADIADQIGADARERTEISWHTVATVPVRSRIRLECRADPL